MTLSDIGKRVLVGRKLRSTQLGETLVPKRIALPVFASHALSSVAYAPDEILLTLSLAGLTASYRQNVHAYPSGGGDYEVATVNLGPLARLTVASALRRAVRIGLVAVDERQQRLGVLHPGGDGDRHGQSSPARERATVSNASR